MKVAGMGKKVLLSLSLSLYLAAKAWMKVAGVGEKGAFVFVFVIVFVFVFAFGRKKEWMKVAGVGEKGTASQFCWAEAPCVSLLPNLSVYSEPSTQPQLVSYQWAPDSIAGRLSSNCQERHLCWNFKVELNFPLSWLWINQNGVFWLFVILLFQQTNHNDN